MQGGFTLLELVVVACIVGVLATLLYNRLQYYQRMAEKASVEQTVGALQSALNLRFASLITQNRIDTAPNLVDQNPVAWLVQKPGNYAGEFFGTAEDVKTGQWYFDLKDRALVYLVRNRGNAGGRDTPQLRFKARLVEGSEDFPGKNGSIAGKTEGVVFEQIVPYEWD